MGVRESVCVGVRARSLAALHMCIMNTHIHAYLQDAGTSQDDCIMVDVPQESDMMGKKLCCPKSHMKTVTNTSRSEALVKSLLTQEARDNMAAIMANPRSRGPTVRGPTCPFLSETFVGLCTETVEQACSAVQSQKDVMLPTGKRVHLCGLQPSSVRAIKNKAAWLKDDVSC